LKTLTEEFAGDDAVGFVAIQTTFEGHQVNTKEKLAPVAKRHELSIPFGQSAGDSGTPEIMKKYRTGGTPWIVLIDKKGIVQFDGFHAAPKGMIAAIKTLKEKE